MSKLISEAKPHQIEVLQKLATERLYSLFVNCNHITDVEQLAQVARTAGLYQVAEDLIYDFNEADQMELANLEAERQSYLEAIGWPIKLS